MRKFLVRSGPALLTATILISASNCLAARAEPSRARTLCDPGEDSAFSCSVGKRVASICTSPTPSDGTSAQYRFGEVGALELQYPMLKEPTRSNFRANSLVFSGGGGG